ncbi:Tim17-domain-containing protein [Zalerion maritima]|uniref:Tim17-domain-containing protein n=1 Tax=Zalerion maritima TaxID=339359 RepID=A0AAD5RWG4_9PEZI|nr:Tim17-domain-containing protein [Zalerion maritima]
MTIWDALTGRTPSSASSSQSQSSQTTTPSSSSPPDSRQQEQQSSSAYPQTPYIPSPSPSSFDPSSAQGVDAFLQPSTFSDPSQLHPLAGLNQEALEYLRLEESQLSDLPGSQSVLPSRGFTDDLCYGTGVTYLTALSIGGAWGLQEGLTRSVGQSPKLRLNSVLNAVTRRGPFLGNSAGVIAIVYNCINSYIGYLRGKHDPANTVLSGALSGMVFKSTRGLKPMIISGGMVASVAGVWAVVRRVFFEPGGP